LCDIVLVQVKGGLNGRLQATLGSERVAVAARFQCETQFVKLTMALHVVVIRRLFRGAAGAPFPVSGKVEEPLGSAEGGQGVLKVAREVGVETSVVQHVKAGP